MTIRATLPLVMAPMFRPFVEQLRRVGSDASAILDRYGITDTMMNDPTMSGMKVKKGAGKRLSPKVKEKLQKERQKQLRRLIRKKK